MSDDIAKLTTDLARKDGLIQGARDMIVKREARIRVLEDTINQHESDRTLAIERISTLEAENHRLQQESVASHAKRAASGAAGAARDAAVLKLDSYLLGGDTFWAQQRERQRRDGEPPPGETESFLEGGGRTRRKNNRKKKKTKKRRTKKRRR